MTVGWGGGSMRFNDFLSTYSPGRIRERREFRSHNAVSDFNTLKPKDNFSHLIYRKKPLCLISGFSLYIWFFNFLIHVLFKIILITFKIIDMQIMFTYIPDGLKYIPVKDARGSVYNCDLKIKKIFQNMAC